MQSHGGVVSKRTMEIVVALALSAIGAVVMFDNHRIGAAWGSDGPQAGYFPFYIGVILTISSVVVLAQAVFVKGEDGSFVDKTALRQVMEVLIPSIVFAVLTWLIGIYVAGAILIAFNMVRFGSFPRHLTAAVAVAVPVFFFFMFEVWFNVPLPKGPLESAFGF